MKTLKIENNMKSNCWYNFGDINPRLHGGLFVRWDGDKLFEVVEVSGKSDGDIYYYFQTRNESIDDLDYRWVNRRNDPVAKFADWDRMNGTCPVYIRRSLQLCDIISYYGGECERESDSNWWRGLKSYGITSWI